MSRTKTSVAKLPRNNYRITKYSVPKEIYDAIKLLMPPEDISVSEWAEKYRVLDSKTSAIPGSWRNDMTPYLVGIMDEFNNYETIEIIFCKPTQVGGTEAMQNMLGYVIQQDPSPTMVVYPTEQLAESISENRLQPMIKASPKLNEVFRDTESKKLELQFDGMYLSLEGSNSPSNLASKAIRFLFLDEVDKYPGNTKKEADPISLARERTKTFHNKKIFMTSTPTLRTGHIWKALEGADIEKHYFVPCPHCGSYIELKWSQIRFPSEDGMSYADRAECAHYCCQECGSIISDHDKSIMIKHGRWQVVRQETDRPRKVAFWMNTLYSPFVRFSDAVKEFLKSKNDPEALQNFVNSWLAEPWEDLQTKTDADMVLDRQTEYPEFVVPEWAKLLTGGVDVQKDGFYYTVRAYGNYITSQNITHGYVTSWADIDRVMNLNYAKESGETYMVSLCFIDSGYNQDDVFEFCIDREEWAIPSKGDNNTMAGNFRDSVIDKVTSASYGRKFVLVNGDRYKDLIADRMKKPNGIGSWMVYKGCDMEYAQQVTAEQKVQEKKNGRMVTRWIPKKSHIDNHYLDCEVYSLAAADYLGVRSIHLEDKEPEIIREDTRTPEESSFESDWMNIRGDWM